MIHFQTESHRELSLATREALVLAPGWARVGLAFGDDRLREQALDELATVIAQRIANPPPEHSPDQLRLAL